MKSLLRTLCICLPCAAPLAAQGVPPAPPPAPAAASPSPAPAVRRAPPAPAPDACTIRDIMKLGRNPTAAELRCRYHAQGPGRFGLLSYLDVPVYQPRTPQPGTHVVGVPGMPHPAPGESYEMWEWRVLRTRYGAETGRVYGGLELADPVFASRIVAFERTLRERGVHARRRETFRSAERQAFIFQQGRSRPGTLATSTLSSWHNRVDRLGRPAARAADYEVPPSQLLRFHALADSAGLLSYGADSNDPGHVYLPDTDAATGMEIAVLRLLPRVPHVTLETGRPYDEPQIPGMPNYWRALTLDFISRPPIYPALTPVFHGGAPSIRIPPPPPPPPPAPPPVVRGRRRH